MSAFVFHDKVVLIVGASSGIGRTLALRLAQRGARIAATARRADRLEALQRDITQAGGQCAVFAADAQSPTAAAEVVRKTVETFGRIDLVVLNAGGAPAIDMRRMTADQVTSYMRLNYDVVVNYLFPVLSQMRLQGGGVVAHTNSLAGLIEVPLQGPYCAAKAAAKMLIDCCRLEFSEFGIRFVTVYPGFVATEATHNDGMPAPMAISEEVAVGELISAISAQKPDHLFPWSMAVLTRLGRLLPQRLRHRLLAKDLPALTP